MPAKIAILAKLTVLHRMIFTWQEARRLEEAQLRPAVTKTATNAG